MVFRMSVFAASGLDMALIVLVPIVGKCSVTEVVEHHCENNKREIAR